MENTETLTLADFLLAQFAEDADRLDLPEFEEEDSARGPGWGNRGDCPVCGAHQWSGTEAVTEEAWWDHAENTHGRSRVLAECEAKRQIVRTAADYSPELENGDNGSWAFDTALWLLAQPYSDHPHYRKEWRP